MSVSSLLDVRTVGSETGADAEASPTHGGDEHPEERLKIGETALGVDRLVDMA